VHEQHHYQGLPHGTDVKWSPNKVVPRRKGIVAGILFQNISMTDVYLPVVVNQVQHARLGLLSFGLLGIARRR